MATIHFKNTYARLPERFYAKQAPQPVESPAVVRINHPLARSLGIDPEALETEAGVAALSGNAVPEGAEPLAMAYAGHQFGHFVPQLGDGRALLLGEVLDREGRRRDLHLKGSGRTAFSRRGDGRSWLGPVIREYLVSEAMHALGVPTTRALAALETGETVFRERPLPGGILVRVAASHIRVGTFQYFAAQGDVEALRQLADFAIDRHDPELSNTEQPYLAFLRAVVYRQAQLVAHWMRIGFIHGVMNTDNMAVSGETIDYGPCAFMDGYHRQTVYSSIDRSGRYAYDQQPGIALWNLCRFAETLLPLLDRDERKSIEAAEAVLGEFEGAFEAARHRALASKIGLASEAPGDADLVQGFLDILEGRRADFTLSFRALCDAPGRGFETPQLDAVFQGEAAWPAWRERWAGRLRQEPDGLDAATRRMREHNPACIPRNHLIERTIRQAVEEASYTMFYECLDCLSTPYADPPPGSPWTAPPKPGEEVRETFCGT